MALRLLSNMDSHVENFLIFEREKLKNDSHLSKSMCSKKLEAVFQVTTVKRMES